MNEIKWQAKQTTYKVVILKPVIIEGREYDPNRWMGTLYLRNSRGKDRIFRSMGSAVRFATECFGDNYKETVHIHATR